MLSKITFFLLFIMLLFSHSQSITEILASNPNLISKYQNSQSTPNISNITSQASTFQKIANQPPKNNSINQQFMQLNSTINPDKYYIAPGDVFKIFIWGKHESSYTLEVNGEQNVLLPLYGIISLKNKTLTETKLLLTETLSSIFKNQSKIEVMLIQPGNFPVYISGEISNPASYQVNSATRLSDLVKMAGNINSDGSLRNIIILNPGSENRVADLASFYNSGKLEANPFLRASDFVFVMKKDETIRIEGSVTKPGKYQLIDGDKLSTIINSAGGLKSNADTNRIFVTRFFNNTDSINTICVPYKNAEHFEIIANDRISINSIFNYRIDRGVFIKGEVKHPGFYPIKKGETKLREIIAVAGGLTDDASLANSLMLRKKYSNIEDREFERIKTIPIRDLSPLESSYLKTKLVENEGILSINFAKLFQENNSPYNITLQNGDEITISKLSKTVKVTGGVIRPGLIKYEQGKNINYYVNKADGLNSRARKSSIMIIKGGTGVVLKPRKVEEIEPGDAIWVPEKTYVNKFEISKDILLVMGAIATLIISAFTIHEFVTE